MADTSLQIVITALDETAGAFANIRNGLNETGTAAITASEQLDKIGGALTAAGATATVIGGTITAAIGSIVDAADKHQAAQQTLLTTIQDQISASQQDATSADSNAAATQKLTAQKNTLNAQIALEQDALDKASSKYGENSAQVAAAQAKLETYQASLAKVNGALEQHSNLLLLTGSSAADLDAKFNAAAAAATTLGFNVDDSTGSLQQLFAATHDVSQSMDLSQTAMDLARFKNEDLGTATQQLVQIMEGGGRAAKQFGINMSETATPAQALAQITQMLSGQAKDYSETGAGKAATAQAEWNKTMIDAGTTLLPILDSIIEKIGGLVQWVDNFVQAHPKVTEAILAVAGVFGLMALAAGAVMLVVGPLLLISAGLAAPFVLGALAVAGLVAAIVGLAIDVALNWKNIVNTITGAWQEIQYLFTTGIALISEAWTAVWTTVGDFVQSKWTEIVNGVKSGVNDVIGILNGLIAAIDAIKINIPAITLGSLKIGAQSIGFNIPQIPLLADGGIVNSPTLAMIGEAGPEAVIPLSGSGAGAFGGITINVMGGYYMDQQAARDMGNQWAKIINQQLKLRNA